jgi:hypothetical protein
MSIADSMHRPGFRISPRALVTSLAMLACLLIGALFMHAMSNQPVHAASSTTHTKGGVSVGYANTRVGAVQAATNYQAMLSDPRMFDAVKRHAIVRTIYAPSVRAKFQTLYDQIFPATADALGAEQGGQMVSRVVPVGWRIDNQSASTSPTSIAVSIWANSVAGSGSAAAQEGWATTTIDLKWVAGDWKIIDLTTIEGPEPGNDSSQDLLLKINGLQEYDNAPRSASS